MTDVNYYIAVLFLITLPVSFLLTRIIVVAANKIGFVACPNPIVDTHKNPTAYGGGISIGAVIILFLLFASNDYFFSYKLIISIIPVIIIGIADDTLKFSPLYKLILEIISLIPFFIFFSHNLIYFNVIFLLFILTTQNAWNLIDIMDGLAAGISFIVFITAGFITFFNQQLEFYSYLSFAIAFSTLGFRFWNKYPAKIFLGDTGSLLLGSLFGFIVVGVFSLDKITSYYLALLGSIPFFELIFLIIVRTKKGIPVYRGSPDHFALKMLNNGYSVIEINYRVLWICTVHSLILFTLSIFDPLNINIIVCFTSTLVPAIFAFRYFVKLPSKS